MPIANYTTTVDALRTVGEIQGMLVGHGARQILINYAKSGVIESVSFIIDTPHGAIPFRLPTNAQAVMRVLEEQEVQPRYRTYEQCVRIAWRIVRDWVRAQMALLETEMVKMEQVFLPYMLIGNNKTLYDKMIDTKFMLEEGKE